MNLNNMAGPTPPKFLALDNNKLVYYTSLIEREDVYK